MTKTKRVFIPLLMLLIALLPFTLFAEGQWEYAGPPREASQTLTVLHTNDHHGHPVAFYDYPADGQGGLPAQATLVKEIRKVNDNVLVLGAGDFNTGRPESNFFYAEPDILGFNYIGYDAMTMGNHEFDPSPRIMQLQIAGSDFPWLCANVVKANGGYIDNVKPYTIKDYGDFKVAIFGLMTETTAESGNPENIRGYTFKDEVETAKALVPVLEAQADIVIALVHIGIYDDVNEGSERLAAQVPGIDLIIDGHTHTKVEEAIMITNRVTGKEVPVVQAKHWGLYMGKVDLTFQGDEVTDVDYELIPINVQYREKLDDGSSIYKYVDKEIPKDPVLLAMLQPFVAQVDAVLNEAIGTATETFFNTDSRQAETAIGNLVADSMLWYANEMGLEADFGFQNGGGVRTDIPEGEILKRDIYEVLPFDNSVAVVELEGSVLRRIFAKTPEAVGHGAMPQVSKGVSFVINTKGGTVQDIIINGNPLDDNQRYRVATNSYLAAGGDGYSMFTDAVDYYDTSLMQRDACIDYISEMGGTITPSVEGRITIK